MSRQISAAVQKRITDARELVKKKAHPLFNASQRLWVKEERTASSVLEEFGVRVACDVPIQKKKGDLGQNGALELGSIKGVHRL